MEPSQEFRAILSAAQTIAINEGISDEDVLIQRINEIAYDATKEQPETEVGKQARSAAADMLKKADLVESPYKSKFNYSKYQDETHLPAMAEVFKIIAEYADALVNFVKAEAPTAEEKAATQDAFEKASIAAFKAMNGHNVAMPRYEHFFNKMRDIISALEKLQLDQIKGHRYEVVSRAFGAVNPGTGKFDANYALYSDLLAARDKIKSETDGPDGEDKFSVPKDTHLEDLE